MATLIFFGIIAVPLIYGIGLYNHLVNVKHAVAKAWANIDVLGQIVSDQQSRTK